LQQRSHLLQRRRRPRVPQPPLLDPSDPPSLMVRFSTSALYNKSYDVSQVFLYKSHTKLSVS
jgi:hypothetical protein